MTKVTTSELGEKFPWLRELNPVVGEIESTLWDKEEHYQGSWQKRGGPGAFMMLARKWDRIENISSSNGYDLFAVLENNIGDIEDDIKDLIGYLVLVLAKNAADAKAAGGPMSTTVTLKSPLDMDQPTLTGFTPPSPPSTSVVPKDDWSADFDPPSAVSKHKPLRDAPSVAEY